MEKENKLLNYIKTNKEYILLSVIILLAFLLRIYKISAPSLWHDELMTIGRISGSWLDTLTNLADSPFPPLYYLILKAWTSLIGISEWSLRFPSALFGAILLIYLYKLTKLITNNKQTAYLAALLGAFWPYLINYSQEAKMYTLVWLLGLASWYYFLIFLKDQKSNNKWKYILSTIALIYTLYLGFLLLLTQIIIWFIYNKNKDYLKSLFIIILSYLPWVSIAFTNISHKKGILWIGKTENYLINLGSIFLSFINSYKIEEINILTIAITILVIYGIYHLIKEKQESLEKNSALFYLITPIILLSLIDYFYTPILVTRYLSFAIFPLIIILSYSINKTRDWNKYIPHILILLIISLFITSNLSTYYENSLKIDRENWKPMLKEICDKWPNSTFLTSTDIPEASLSFYAPCVKDKLFYLSLIKEQNFNDSSIVFFDRYNSYALMNQYIFEKENDQYIKIDEIQETNIYVIFYKKDDN
ncbi:MAG: glycosyltransferase family 39 protein [Nanoarchaeota archaeon]